MYSAALYMRVSKEDENLRESESIANQRSLLKNFVNTQGFNIYDTYIDDGFSGGNYERPAFIQMIRDIEAKKVNIVVTKDMSRLGRDYIQTGYYLEKYFPENNIRYIAILDNIDTGIESYLNDITPFKAIMNDLYAKDISKKIRSVKQDKIKRGKFIGGKAPYGYKKCTVEKNKIVIDEEVSLIVKKMFDMALSGESGRSIALKLTQEGIEPPSVYAKTKLSRTTAFSNCWKSEVVTNMLKNEVYIGNMVQGRMKKVSYKSKKSIRLPKEDWIVVENTHNPIIDKDVYAKVQVLLDKKRVVKTSTLDYPLKGIVCCNDCKIAMGIVPKKDKYYLRCRTYAKFTKLKKCTSHSIRADLVERNVSIEIQNMIKSCIDIEQLTDIAMNAISSKKYYKDSICTIDKLNIRLENINKDIDKIYADKISGIIDEEDFIRIYNSKKDEKNKLSSDIKELRDNLKNKEVMHDREYARSLAEDFIYIKKYENLIYTEIVSKVEVGESKEIFIYFKV